MRAAVGGRAALAEEMRAPAPVISHSPARSVACAICIVGSQITSVTSYSLGQNRIPSDANVPFSLSPPTSRFICRRWRRALRDGQDGNRFIVTIPGRGYCFVASVATSAHEKKNFCFKML